MKRKMLLIVVLALALLAGAVAVGIHVLHKQVLAVVMYTVEIYDEEEIPVDNATVWFSFDDGENWLPTIPLGNGRYECQMNDYQGTWLIWLEEPNILGDNEIEGSATLAFQHWDVVLDDD